MRGLAFAGYPRTLRHKSLILERLLDIDRIALSVRGCRETESAKAEGLAADAENRGDISEKRMVKSVFFMPASPSSFDSRRLPRYNRSDFGRIFAGVAAKREAA